MNRSIKTDIKNASGWIRSHDKALNVVFLGDRHQFIDYAANQMLTNG
jgi:hypothetical protein